MSSSNKDLLFKPSNRAENKWETTNSVSRSMIEAEHSARAKKTEKLRKLRLEADQNAEAAPAKPATKRRTKKVP